MSVSRKKLEFIRWTFAAITVGLVIASRHWRITGGWAAIWFGLFILFGFPAAMLTLHLHPPKFFKYLERRR